MVDNILKSNQAASTLSEMPLISIIMPSYNQQDFMRLTIDSIIAQTYTNWELVVTDDASPDNSYEVLLEYAAKDARIKPVRIERDKTYTTQCAVRKHAIARAQGELFTFMDSDDLFEPDAFENMVRYLKEHPECQCAYGLFREIDMESRIIAGAEERHWNDLPINHNEIDYKELHTWDNIIYQRIPMMLQLMMVRRPFLESFNGFNSYVFWDDYYFFVSMAMHNLEVVHRIPHHVFRYRYNHGGVSKSPAMFKKLLANVRVTIEGLTKQLKVQKIDPKYTASHLSAKMYADIAWLRLRSGLRDQTVQACWYGFCDTNVTFADWSHFCGGLFAKAIVPEPMWNIVKTIKNTLQPQKSIMAME